MSELDAVDTLERLDDETVLQFLADHPDFFMRHPGAATGLNLAHDSGAAVSLVERQVATLREGNRRMRSQVDDMISAARHNQTLSEGVHALAQALLASDSATEMAAATETTLLRVASADRVAIVLSHDAADASAPGDVLRHVAPSERAWDAFSAQRDDDLIRCGLASEGQLTFLFGDADAVGSSAIAPLRTDRWLGVLALAAQDPTVFTRDQGHLFLQQVADLVGAAFGRTVS
ncbi:MAG: DUF484 family protein [Pseudomonadota bacterium]